MTQRQSNIRNTFCLFVIFIAFVLKYNSWLFLVAMVTDLYCHLIFDLRETWHTASVCQAPL